MTLKRTINFLSILFILPLVALLSIMVFAQEDTAMDEEDDVDTIITRAISENDTTFVELHLSPDGVYGVDSAGTEWEYDFSREMFVNEEGGTERSTTVTVFGQDRRLPRPPDYEELYDNLDELDAEELARIAEETAQLTEKAMLKKYKGLQLRSVEIEEGEIVDGSIVAVGPVTVKGIVNGDVISYKRVTVSSTGIIDGDVRAPEIVKMRGGTITGQRFETELPTIPELKFFETSSYTAIWVTLIILFSLLFCGLIAVAVISKPIDRIKTCLEIQFVKSFFIGFGGWFALGPLFGILCLTIIGIPLAVFVLPLGLLLGIVLGIIAVCHLVGQLSSRYVAGSYGTQLRQILLGLVVLYVPWIMMALFMASPSGVAEGFSILFMVISIIIWSVVVSLGVGAVVLTRFGTRDCKKGSDEILTVRVHSRQAPPPPSPPPLKSDDDRKNNSE